jgi:hypothetical protein
MSLNIFLIICILGIDFMIYVLFQWIFGDKRKTIARQVALTRQTLSEQSPRPYSLHHNTPNEAKESNQSDMAGAVRNSASGIRQHASYRERIA